MDCLYINLDRQADRRTALTDSFRRWAPPHWTLRRLPAVDAAAVGNSAWPGSLSDGAKACLLSHRRAIEGHRGQSRPLLILEDDARLGPSTGAAVDQILAMADSTAKVPNWDLLFTDVILADLESMVRYARRRPMLMAHRQVELADLQDLSFAGSTAYILHPRAVDKLAALLAAASGNGMHLNTPYDLLLRQWVRQRHLQAWMTFPFLTTVAANADESQIQTGEATSADRVWNAYRRAMWFDRQDAELQTDLDHLRREICDEESDRIGTILSAGLSSRIRWK